jgi:uncharacterized membrane protein YoaK (UPF0700 family)
MASSEDDDALRPGERTRAHLAIAAALAAVAGCVDAVFFGRIAEVFPANQSGNAVLLGIGIGDGSAGDAWRPAVSIVGFGLGVTAAVVMRSRVRQRRRAPMLIAVEFAFLAPIAVVLVGTPRPADELAGGASGILLIATAISMGIQTEVIGRVAGVSVATTYQSGAIARIGELAAQRNRTVALPGLAVLGVVLGGYVTGAALGAATADWGGTLLVPLAVLALLAITLTIVESRSPSFVV